ncbi:MAG: hypothetical protein AAGI24_04025 [Pseudomonadota bacterium]
MAINPTDVKLYESQRLTDEDDGGGRATGNEVVDGQINNLFPDISRLDRTLGDVALRKAFLGIDTNNADVYLGAHAVVVQPPADGNVSIVLFDAGSESDERSDAQNRIESYVVQGATAELDLLGNQFQGQRQLVCWQRVEATLPQVGDVFYLFDPNNSTPEATIDQYVRVTEVEADDEFIFTTQSGSTFTEFTRRRLVLSISAPLEHTFPGGEFTPTGPTDPHSEIFTTEVADAARYWGVTNSESAAAPGDLQILAQSIYANLVPSAQSEQPLIDQGMGGVNTGVRAATAADYTETFSILYLTSTAARGYTARAIVPGTATVTISTSTYTDDGAGTLTRVTGGFPFATFSIDYDSGLIEGTRDSGTATPGTTADGSITYRPGAPYTGRLESLSVPITLANRSFNYTANLAATKPRPGTMVVSFMALGEWFELRDSGTGELQGAGTGSVDFTTGTVAVTLEALPDVGTAVIYQWLMDIEDEVTVQTGAFPDAGAQVSLQASAGAIDPGTLIITYTAASTARTMTDDGAGGFTGDGTGTIDYANGVADIVPAFLPDQGTGFDLAYDTSTPQTEVAASPSPTTGILAGSLTNTPVKTRSVSFTYQVQRLRSGAPGTTSEPTGFITLARLVQDDGAGNLVDEQGASIGTVDYATGAYSFEALDEYDRTYNRISTAGFTKDLVTVSATLRESYVSASMAIAYSDTADVTTPATDNAIIPNSLTFELLPTANQLVPGSLLFTFAGETFIDRDGILYQAFVSSTGAATAVGSVDYNAARATIDSWAPGATPGIDILAALTSNRATLTTSIAFRTPGAPLRPQSLQITITDIDGNLIVESADANGNITGASVDGTVNVETGIVQLDFTDGVDPVPVFPDTGRYNAIVVSFLPLDASLIGLDPVRLPSDGRVPIFRQGDVIVISHTQTADIGTPTAGQVFDTGRDFIAAVEITDSAGVDLDPAQYAVNRVTGVVTFADPLLLQDASANALTAPFNVANRVEHMSVVNDVQITGEVSFIAPLAHDYPANETVISSALVWGDINSRVFAFFTQRTWDSGNPNWTDQRIGDDTTAQYNEIDNPVEFANNGAITERWALVFTGATNFNIVGQNLGIIGQGSTATDTAPPNPNTGNPYFIIRAAGWGSGWIAGNVVRFNTEGALAPIWIARTVLSGQASVEDDEFTLQIRGDAD